MPGSLALHSLGRRNLRASCPRLHTLLMVRWFYMETLAQYLETSAQYREFAEECDRLAQGARTDDHRKILEEMAKAWRMVAAEMDTKR
jgi:hypothetical protein